MDRIKSAINKIWSYELSHMFVYSVIINIVMECLNKRGVTGLLSIFTSPVIFLICIFSSFSYMDDNSNSELYGAVFKKDSFYGDGYIPYK